MIIVKKNLVTLFCLFMLFSCTSDKDSNHTNSDFYIELQNHIKNFTFTQGEWREDYGDASFYGVAFYIREGVKNNNNEYIEISKQGFERNIKLINENSIITGDQNELFMAVLGIIEYMSATNDFSFKDDLIRFFSELTDIINLFEYYIEEDVAPGYAMDNFGPTAVNAYMAILYLQYAYLIGGENKDIYLENAKTILNKVKENSFNGKFYNFSKNRTEVHLYPNFAVIIGLVRLYQCTLDESYLNHAVLVYNGIDSLKVDKSSGLEGIGRYLSPYSSEYMGAQTDDYTTFSSQNGIMFALTLLFEVTKDNKYLDEIYIIMDFINENLIGQWCLSDFHKTECEPNCRDDKICIVHDCKVDLCSTGILHHWMDGELAKPEHNEFFCSGCTLQLLYLVWYQKNLH